MSELDQALAEAAEEVLSTMFFTMLDSPPDSAEGVPCTRVNIEFRGHWTGALSLCSSAEASAEMATNFLGLDGQDAPASEEQEAVAKELANMICGAVLSRLNSTEVFQLLSPELTDSPDDAPSAASGQIAEQVYGVGAGFLSLKFRLDEPA